MPTPVDEVVVCTGCGRSTPLAGAERLEELAPSGEPRCLCPDCAARRARQPAPSSTLSGWAAASLFLGVLGWCTCVPVHLVGFVCGIVALRFVAASHGTWRGRGPAIAGTALSGAGLLAAAGVIVVLSRSEARRANCLNNARQLANAFVMYAQDYDWHLPGKLTWCDSIAGRSGMWGSTVESTFKCPQVPDQRCGYAFNARLSGAEDNAFDYNSAKARVVMLFDATGTWNTSGGIELLAPRHADRATVGFADGHVKQSPPSSARGYLWDMSQARK